MNFKNMNESAVSPIVATLVLIVVAVVGAVAVGTIMGTFSSDVAEQTNVGDVGGSASAEVLIAGSTTVQPVSEILAEAYMNQKPGVKITVQGGGSGAGISSVGMGIADIGSASRPMNEDEVTQYPNLVQHKIGGSVVVFIANKNATTTIATVAALADEYDTPTSGNVVYERDESSGTEDTAKEYLGVTFADTTKETGNAGILKAVQDTDAAQTAIGFVDWSYAADATGIYVADITDTGDITWVSPSAMDTDELKLIASLKAQDLDNPSTDDGEDYPVDLGRLLFYITNGNPSSVVKNYIEFTQSPAAFGYFEETGYWPIVELM